MFRKLLGARPVRAHNLILTPSYRNLPRGLPRDDLGYLISDARFGSSVMVVKTYNTDSEGNWVDFEDWSNQTFHGPFIDEEEAQTWMNESPDDMDVKDWSIMWINNVR